MPRSITSTWIVGVLLAWAGSAASEPRPAVVELYSSEGCSSCPPAEAFIGELAHRGDVLALAFHVDYWDTLGWTDRFALPDAASRQRAYAKVLARSSVYTPQIFVDGRENFVGSDRRGIGRALTGTRAEGIPIALRVSDGSLTISLGQQNGIPASEVTLIAYQRHAISRIAHGENAGRQLEEFNIVRSFRTLGRWDGGARQFSARLDALPPGATDVAVLVQPLPLGPIIGAATLPIS